MLECMLATCIEHQVLVFKVFDIQSPSSVKRGYQNVYFSKQSIIQHAYLTQYANIAQISFDCIAHF